MKMIGRFIFFIILVIILPSNSVANSAQLDEVLKSNIENYEKETDHFQLAKNTYNDINDRQIIVKAKKNVDFNPAHFDVNFVEEIHLSQFENNVNYRLYVVQVPEQHNYLEKLAQLNTSPHILHAEPNTILESSVQVIDSFIKDQWYLQTIDIFRAWEIERGSNNITIGVIDSGVNRNHPDLRERVLNGFDFIDNQSGTTDINGHGTHIAGIIAANINQLGVAGLDHHVNILPIKVFHENGKGTLTNAIKGIYYAIEQEVDIINMSYASGEKSELEREAINKAYEKGIVLIASSGNDGKEGEAYPAAYRKVISVGATNRNDQRASFSNYGQTLDIAAPGVDIYGPNDKDGYNRGSGTSFSAPIISAVAALIKAKNPQWNNNEIEWALQYGAENNEVATGEWDKTIGFGRVNAYHSLIAQLPNPDEDVRSNTKHAYELTKQTAVNGRFQLPHDVDLFTFTLNHNLKVNLHITNIPDHIDPVAILSKVNNYKVEKVYVIDEFGMGRAELFNRHLEKGTYYLSLYDYYGRWSEKPYTIHLDVTTFTDVKQYEREIEHLIEQGIIRGFSDGTFRPEQPVTRLQAVMMILNEMGINVEKEASKLTDPRFTDVKQGDYGYNYIAKAVELGFIEGKNDNTFDRYGHLTRGQMAAILVKAYNLNGTDDRKFKDIPTDHWAYQFVNSLVANGITKGYSDQTYRPNETISREHFALMLYRVIDFQK